MAQLDELALGSHDSPLLKFLKTKSLQLLMYCVLLRITNVEQPCERELVDNTPWLHQSVVISLSNS